MNSFAKPTFIIKTLGCKVNQYESQAIRESLTRNGFLEKDDDRIADFYIINSCTVTSKADKETRNLIHNFHRMNPNGKIVVAGCYAELQSDRNILMKIPGVVQLVRNSEKEKIADIFAPHNERVTMGISNFKDRNRAFIKIQDGCNHRCSYCKVSLVRGPSRSRQTEEILKESKSLVERGFKEIVLTGVCLGAWQPDLADLIEKISQFDGLFRIRLSSIEPIYVITRLIKVLKNNDKVCKHLHIPLQSGDNRILKAMNRTYTRRTFKRLIRKIRTHVPDVAITTDVLVGFPGEDEGEFRNTLKFIKDIRPSRMHIFSYSKREGTLAAKYSYNLDKNSLRQRLKTLAELNNEFSAYFAKSLSGKTENAIIESSRDETTGLLVGYTDRYIRVFVDEADNLKKCLIPVKITRVDEKKNMVFACPAHLDNKQII